MKQSLFQTGMKKTKATNKATYMLRRIHNLNGHPPNRKAKETEAMNAYRLFG
jgi:hypothetical protein